MLDDAEVLGALADGRPVHTHHAKELMRWLLTRGVDLTGLVLDTAIAAYLIDPAETQYALSELLVRYTGDTLPEGGAPERAARLLGAARRRRPAGLPATRWPSARWRPCC